MLQNMALAVIINTVVTECMACIGTHPAAVPQSEASLENNHLIVFSYLWTHQIKKESWM